jgi:4-carboxymuconolactone decarboxylase
MGETTDREARAEETYARLFGSRDRSAPDNDPEFGRILRTFIFGDVFSTGDLNDTTRELITVTVLATLNTLNQLRAHTRAALNVGVTPVELREAVYQLAPFIGFPRTLNAVAALNEVFDDRGVPLPLPLPPQATTTDTDRFARGRAIQEPLYGTEIADELADEPLAGVMPRFLTEFLFGDLYSRTGLELATRELLILCALATLGLERQLRPHVTGAIKAGSSRDSVLAALIHCFPYIGFPNAMNAIRVVREVTQ